MRISSHSLLCALTLTTSATPIQDGVSTICKAANNVWSTFPPSSSAPITHLLLSSAPPSLNIDTIYGTPKTTPKTFEGNSKIGPASGMGGSFKDSDHFRVYGAQSDDQAARTLAMLEAAYDCYVNDLRWRTSGLSYNAKSDEGYAGAFWKENVFGKGSLGSAAGVMNTDMRAGLSYVQVIAKELANPAVTVHEYGHALTYHEKGWVDQQRTGTWWEPVANWFADTYMTSDLCAAARKRGNQPTGQTVMRLDVVISRAHQVIVDGTAGSGNYYESWPFLTYLTNNPDNIEGLGKYALRNMFRRYKKGTNETPLHAIAYITETPVREIVAKYWARMAFVDIGHTQAKALFEKTRSRLNYANLDGAGGVYKPKASRMPKYFGANIIPLKVGGGNIGVKITAEKPFIATLAVRKGGEVHYVACPNGSCGASVGAGEEAMLTIVNAPKELILYDGFKIGGAVGEGMGYELKLTGATV